MTIVGTTLHMPPTFLIPPPLAIALVSLVRMGNVPIVSLPKDSAAAF